MLTAGSIAVIVATAFLYNRWMLDARMFFYADDWGWLWRAEFLPWDTYTILPALLYNDRPVGALWISMMYSLFELNHGPFQLGLLFLHAVNCVLLFCLMIRHTGRSGALLAALLAAVWSSANVAVNWVAAVFDVLGATLCLATLLFRQLAIRSRHGIGYDMAGAACYLLAVRTKEFALGAVALLFLMNVLVERQSVRATFRQLLPYLVVFIVCAIAYARLLAASAPSGDNPYRLLFTAGDVIANLGYYISSLFYVEAQSEYLILAALVVGLGIGLLIADDPTKRIALVGIAGFVILLGPTLLLSAHQDPLYLYAPHFFMAMTIGALFARPVVPAMIAIAASIAVVVPPLSAMHNRAYAIGVYHSGGDLNQHEFRSVVALLNPLRPGATIVISGVRPFFNPFWPGPGDSLKLAFKDDAINVIVERPDAVLLERFCAAAEPKHFLRFSGATASDVSPEMRVACDQAGRRPG